MISIIVDQRNYCILFNLDQEKTFSAFEYTTQDLLQWILNTHYFISDLFPLDIRCLIQDRFIYIIIEVQTQGRSPSEQQIMDFFFLNQQTPTFRPPIGILSKNHPKIFQPTSKYKSERVLLIFSLIASEDLRISTSLETNGKS